MRLLKIKLLHPPPRQSTSSATRLACYSTTRLLDYSTLRWLPFAADDVDQHRPTTAGHTISFPFSHMPFSSFHHWLTVVLFFPSRSLDNNTSSYSFFDTCCFTVCYQSSSREQPTVPLVVGLASNTNCRRNALSISKHF